MSDEVKASIASQLAELELLVAFPLPPFGYGSDISCDFDLDPDVLEVDPFSTRALAEAIVRRLDCPRGQLPDDPNYGIGLRQYLNRGTTDRELLNLAGQVRAELIKDDRIQSVSVTVTPGIVARNLRIELAVLPFRADIDEAADAGAEGFELTLNASDASILIEEIRASR